MTKDSQDQLSSYALARDLMVEEQIAQRGLRNPRLLDVFRQVPRHLFVPEEYRYAAYDDHPLPIGFGQTISQPYIVALMTDLLGLAGNERILEVGTGSGYQAAILAHLAGEIHTVELISALASQARQKLQELGLFNVHVHHGDGSLGWPEAAPYAGILVTAAAPEAPQPLLDQLIEGGRLVLPVGGHGMQVLEVWNRTGQEFTKRVVSYVAFVPLRGSLGWKAN